MAEPVVGCFHARRMVGDRVEALSVWRVTTADPGTAEAVAGLLGGEPRLVEASGGGGWEVVTASDTVGVVIGSVEPMGLRFRLADGDALGVFGFSCAPWTLREITTKGAARLARVGGRDPGELAITTVDLRTLTGLYIRRRVPALRLLDPRP